jgi:hypothetical protein
MGALLVGLGLSFAVTGCRPSMPLTNAERRSNLTPMPSLAAVIDRLDESLFFARPLPTAAKAAAARFIARRQGLPGSYAGMFAPVTSELADGFHTFTGEALASNAAPCHILGEEACRLLILLKVPATKPALERATANMIARLDETEQRGYPVGTYCCGTCSCSYWRHLAAGGLNRQEDRLAAGLKILESRRQPNGRWRAFPFWYTLLALTEMNLPVANAEMQFAAPVCERYVRRVPAGKYAARRRRVAELVLERA